MLHIKIKTKYEIIDDRYARFVTIVVACHNNFVGNFPAKTTPRKSISYICGKIFWLWVAICLFLPYNKKKAERSFYSNEYTQVA